MKKVQPQNDVLTVEEVARFLGISKASVYEALRKGEIPHARIGRRLLVLRKDLEALFRREKS
jgi:excisionase family DNA binding protein